MLPTVRPFNVIAFAGLSAIARRHRGTDCLPGAIRWTATTKIRKWRSSWPLRKSADCSVDSEIYGCESKNSTNAGNMDTGYVNYLSDSEKQDVLRWAREALGQKVPFVAGAYIENRAGDVVH